MRCAAEGVDLGLHERLGHALDHGAQEVDIALLDQLAHLLQTVHRDLDHRVSPFIVLPRTLKRMTPVVFRCQPGGRVGASGLLAYGSQP